jgi:hypothetical protein
VAALFNALLEKQSRVTAMSVTVCGALRCSRLPQLRQRSINLYSLLEPGEMTHCFRDKKYLLSLNGSHRAHGALDDAGMIWAALEAETEGE